uniref:Histidyl tRNA synthetase-related domain-containing protein n=1 Tax=Callorhinchus milii TaxID=7868 RepID=A0A4W3GFT5_CALMI
MCEGVCVTGCVCVLQAGLCRCETLVVAMGRLSMGRALNIVHNLWLAAIPAEVLYHVSQSQEEVQELCRQPAISYLVLVSDKEGNHVKVQGTRLPTPAYTHAHRCSL